MPCRGCDLRGLHLATSIRSPRFWIRRSNHCTHACLQSRGLVRPSTSTSSHSFGSAKSLLVEMYFSPALVLAVLPLLVAAVPFEERSRDGVSIPIAKRSGFHNADGVVDIAKLQGGLRRTVALVFRTFYRTLATRLTMRPFAGKYSAASRRLRGIPAQLTSPCPS